MNLDRNVDNPENYKFQVFYYNPKDKRIIVPKQDKNRGWTLNFGNRFTYIILLVICLVIIAYQFII